jgi:hypothetical protein
VFSQRRVAAAAPRRAAPSQQRPSAEPSSGGAGGVRRSGAHAASLSHGDLPSVTGPAARARRAAAAAAAAAWDVVGFAAGGAADALALQAAAAGQHALAAPRAAAPRPLGGRRPPCLLIPENAAAQARHVTALPPGADLDELLQLLPGGASPAARAAAAAAPQPPLPLPLPPAFAALPPTLAPAAAPQPPDGAPSARPQRAASAAARAGFADSIAGAADGGGGDAFAPLSGSARSGGSGSGRTAMRSPVNTAASALLNIAAAEASALRGGGGGGGSASDAAAAAAAAAAGWAAASGVGAGAAGGALTRQLSSLAHTPFTLALASLSWPSPHAAGAGGLPLERVRPRSLTSARMRMLVPGSVLTAMHCCVVCAFAANLAWHAAGSEFEFIQPGCRPACGRRAGERRRARRRGGGGAHCGHVRLHAVAAEQRARGRGWRRRGARRGVSSGDTMTGGAQRGGTTDE